MRAHREEAAFRAQPQSGGDDHARCERRALQQHARVVGVARFAPAVARGEAAARDVRCDDSVVEPGGVQRIGFIGQCDAVADRFGQPCPPAVAKGIAQAFAFGGDGFARIAHQQRRHGHVDSAAEQREPEQERHAHCHREMRAGGTQGAREVHASPNR
ncbi:hypothetical protein [Noviluteimonas dokdonensis]|uniref:hypothetical protein n=1 Tax=Noviluteimonas dokdonensis TaxID=414050 RepID=UPI00068A1A42|nr:hypothetical protein [Lysobacter dokdonensis]